MKKHVFLTGEPGIGKTTICKQIIEHFKHQENVHGFYTEEVRGADSKIGRIGFDVVSVKESLRFPLARLSSACQQVRGPTFSKYTVDIDNFERNAVPLLKNVTADVSLYVIDEIGKMELFSHRFKSSVMDLFDVSNVFLLCTVPIYSMKFADNLKNRDDVEVFNVTSSNRDHLDKELIRRIGMNLSQIK